MATFAEWRTTVLQAFAGGVASRAQVIGALKDGARAILVRDTESDLALARSYQDRFNEAKVRLAGASLTEDLSTTIASVRALMPVDDDTDEMSAVLDNAIESVRDEFLKATGKFDEYLLQVAKELQAHVPFYQPLHLLTIRHDTDGVQQIANVSQIPLPEGSRLAQVWFGAYYPALEAGVELEADDIVVSNGRLYQVVTGGTPTVYDLETGLTSTDGEIEELGDLEFTHYETDRDFPVRQVDWNARKALLNGVGSQGPYYAHREQSDVILVYPPLDEDNRYDLEYITIAEEFGDSDVVTFERLAAEAAAHFVRAMFAQHDQNDLRQAGASFALYQRALRKAVLHDEERERGAGNRTVVPFDWRRRPRFWGSCIAATSTYTPPNAWFARTNTSGNTTLNATAANMVFDVTITGSASPRNLILGVEGRTEGDRMVVFLTLPASVIEIGFLNADEDGASLLPAETFPEDVFVTDGETQSAVFEFTFDGTAWEYISSRSPA